MNVLHSKKFKHGSVSLALVIIIIAAVILINAIFTALSDKYLWYVDMTADSIYTLSDAAKELLAAEFNTGKKVKVIFCAEKDILESSAEQRMAHNTLRDIANIYDNIEISYVDIYSNPSAVTPYKVHTSQSINSQSIIIASENANGTMECRVHSLVSLFEVDSSTGVAQGYHGEQKLISSLLAVTQDQMPIACFTINHGEADNANLTNLATVLYETGYEYMGIDLSKEDIPEEARLLVIFDPQSDFTSANSVGVDELAKIDAFLAKQNALMTFVDDTTPYLENLEQFLAEWGIQIARYDEAIDNNRENDYSILIQDKDNSLTDDGYTVKGFFVPVSAGFGASLTKSLSSKASPKTVVLQKATAFTVPEGFVPEALDDGSSAWSYSSSGNGAVRTCYDVLLSSSSAVAIANGQKLRDAQLETIRLQGASTIPFSYMRVTAQEYNNAVTGEQAYSYVLACSSTDFAKAAALSSSYGNHELLTYACSQMGRDVVSVSLDYKPFSSTEIKNLVASDATQYTIVLTVVPAAVVFIAGVVIMIRRKYA